MLPNIKKFFLPVARINNSIKEFYSNKALPLLYKYMGQIYQPYRFLKNQHFIYKKYSEKYRMFYSFVKAFLLFFFGFGMFSLYPLESALLGPLITKTEYQRLTEQVYADPTGTKRAKDAANVMIQKGKKHGLLSIQLSQLSYMLQPAEVAWQGKYLASLKS